MPSKSPVYGYSIIVEDTRAHLDPERFNMTLHIDREDGRPLTRADIKAIQAYAETHSIVFKLRRAEPR